MNTCKCGKEINDKRNRNKYCDDCIILHVYNRKSFEYLKGRKSIRARIIKTRGMKCEICKRIKWMGKEIPIVLDHIDGNSDNNSVGNLRLVCPNCDAQLPTYKSKNRGKGRHYRRQRYAEGKSY